MAILYSQDFETASIGDFTVTNSDVTISTEQFFAGAKSLKARIPALVGSTAPAFRAEINDFPIISGQEYLAHGVDYWIGFALYIPSDFHTTPASQDDIVWQMHNEPSNGVYRYPTNLLTIGNNSFKWVRRGYSSTGAVINQDTWDCGAVIKGSWHKIVININCHDSNGKNVLWINGDKKVEELSGINNTVIPKWNGSSGYRPFFKMGLYTWVRKSGNSAYPGTSNAEIITYTDSLKVGDAAAVYADVDPSGGGSNPNPVPSITSVNSGTNAITANTSLAVAVTTGMSGAISGAISDGTTTETIAATGYPSGNQVDFNIGPLTDITSPAILALNFDEPDYYNVSPRAWNDNCGSTEMGETDYTTVHGPFDAGRTLNAVANNWVRSDEPFFTVSTGDVVTAEFYYIPGTSGKVLLAIGTATGAEENKVLGTIGSISALTTQQLSAGGTFTETTSALYPSVKIGTMQFTVEAGKTDVQLYHGIGPYSSVNGQTVISLGFRAWKNRATDTRSIAVSIPALIPGLRDPLNLTAVSPLTSGSIFSVDGTDLDTFISGVITNGTTSRQITDWVSSGTTEAQATAPFNLPTGSLTLIATYARRAVFNNVSSGWSSNTGSALNTRPYNTATWIAATGIIIETDGQSWHRTSQQMSYVKVGDVVTCQFFYIAGTSNRVSLNVRMNSLNLTFDGAIGALPSTPTDIRHGSNASVSTQTINGVIVSTMTFTSTLEGYISMGIGHNSAVEFATIIALAKRSWTNEANATDSIAVTVSTSTNKKFVWSAAGGNAIYTYNAGSNTFTPFTGTMVVKITSGDYFSPGAVVSELAYAPAVAFVAGEGEISEDDLTTGSIDVLLTGEQGYNYWATNGTSRADNTIQLTAV